MLCAVSKLKFLDLMSVKNTPVTEYNTKRLVLLFSCSQRTTLASLFHTNLGLKCEKYSSGGVG